MRRRVVLAIAGWLAAAAAAVATGVLALAIIGEGLSGPSVAEPLSEAEVASALAETPPPTRPPAAPSASPSNPNPATASPTPPPRLLTTPGGSVVARCAGGLATLVSWTPAQGYAVTKADSEPDDSPQVRFERGEDRVDVRVECGPDGPNVTWKRD